MSAAKAKHVPALLLALKYLQASLDFAAVVALTTERPKFTRGLTPVKPMDLDHQWSQPTLSRSSQFMARRGSAEKKPSHLIASRVWMAS